MKKKFWIWCFLLCVVGGGIILKNFLPRDKDQKEAEEILSHLSLKQKIGTLLVIGFEGTSPHDETVIKMGEALEKGYLGGIIFYPYNILSLSQCSSLTAYFSKKSPRLPPFLCIDQEGGAVLRLSPQKGFNKFLRIQEALSLKGTEGFFSPYKVAKEMSPQDAYTYYLCLAQELKDAGFNFNLGPSVDINIDPLNPAIGLLERSFSDDPTVVATYAASFIKAHSALGILTAAKHFPGHGSTLVDSHQDLPSMTSTYHHEEELFPYRYLQSQGLLVSVMVGHLFHEELDPSLPTSLSGLVIKKLLRTTIKFEGLCLTDALDMGALNKFSLKEIVISALKAGNDILLFSNHPKAHMINSDEEKNFNLITPEEVINIVQTAIQDGILSEDDINTAALKVLKTKLALKRGLK